MFNTRTDCQKSEMALKRQKGSAAVEFALVLPILVVMMFGIIEFGLALYDKAVITNASREGARAGIVFKDTPVSDGEIKTLINDYCEDKLVTFGADKNVTTTITREGPSSGDDLTVMVAYKYDYLVLPDALKLLDPIDLLPDVLNLNATTIMRME